MLFTQMYGWMSGFAAIPMYLYNGKRGRGNKKLFYWFYPAHVYVLYGISWVMQIF
ncbi:TraX family protein [Eisenbergiella massiliensis]|nr:TraX family protein [Eisenbergiella massiliensis]